MLEPVATDIWLTEGDVVDFFGFAYPTRSVIVRLADGALWVWSPVRLSAALKSEVDELGPVGHLVSPNKIHHLYLAAWQAAYPEALLWGPQSTLDKRRDLKFHAALGETPPADWGGQIAQFWFRGSFFMDEIVFFHRPSRCAIVADLSENFGDDFLRRHWPGWQRAIAALWGITKGHAPLEWRLSFWRRGLARAARDRLLSCDPEVVIMAHGEWQPTNGRAFLSCALAWLGK